MESKLASKAPRSRTLWSLNRTIVELKHLIPEGTTGERRLNRTIVELKRLRGLPDRLIRLGLNRTIVELKHNNSRLIPSHMA